VLSNARCRGGAIVVLVALVAACSEPLEFADWTLPVPQTAETFGYAAVPLSERQGRAVELVEDLVIRSRGEDERYLLYQPRDIDVGPDGSIYVLDDGYFHVKIYDAHGEHVRTFSQEGEGPAELSAPVAAAIAGDRYIIADGGRRLSVWSLAGDYIDDMPLPVRPNARPFVGLDDGSVLISFLRGYGDNIVQSSQEGALRIAFGRLVPGAGEPQEYAAFPQRIILFGRGPDGIDTPLNSHQRSFTGSPDGSLYLSNGDEYQVLSLDTAGAARWALRVAWPRQSFPDAEIDHFLEQVREGVPDAMRSELIVADLANTLEPLHVDGHGHLYVFPRVFVHPNDESQERPVDVFSPLGELLFSGYFPQPNWQAARGDFVYRLEYDSDAGEQTIVRYRLLEPFD
jgi:hypothetical protein